MAQASYVDEAGRALIAQAVTEAEASTSGEIVTVLTEQSDDYNDVALLWAAGAAFTAMSVFAALPRPFLNLWDRLVAGWGHQWTTGELASMTIGLGLIAFAAMLALQQYQPLKFALVPAPVKTARAHAAAIRLFRAGTEQRTIDHTGVLIYLSMADHRAEIVADTAIAEKVAPEIWGEAMGDMLAEIRKGCVAEGLAAGIRDVGFVLAEHFPKPVGDTNQLPDCLIEL
ncbi:MAG: TPM domain-containing protein [Erythrobacter sp.]